MLASWQKDQKCTAHCIIKKEKSFDLIETGLEKT